MAKRGKKNKSDKQRKHAQRPDTRADAPDFGNAPPAQPAQPFAGDSNVESAEGPDSPWYNGGGATPMVARRGRSGRSKSGMVGEVSEEPFYNNGDDTPLLARHVHPLRGKKGRRDDSDSMPLFPITPHHTHERRIKGFGWIRDIPDVRDHFYAAPLFLDLPTRYSLREYCPAIYNQLNLGSCAANAIAAAVQFERMRQALSRPASVPSRLFIYYNQRSIERDVLQDRGGQIRDGIKSVAALGACFEGIRKDEWPYDETKFAQRPPEACYIQASHDRCVSYSRIRQQLDQLKGCIASGWPFVFGFTCYESFESAGVAHGGVLPLPRQSEHAIGGHAVLAVGYDDVSATFEVRNSWGSNWGNGGYFTMPYSYVTDPNLSGDFWTIRLVSATG